MNSKYLKYKNKYTLLKESIFNNSLNTDNKNSIILYGSGFFSLQGEERDIYIARCEKMYCNSLPEAECYSIIKKNCYKIIFHFHNFNLKIFINFIFYICIYINI